MKKYLLLCSALVVASSAYAEINCSVRPSCTDLGYTQTETDCAGKYILKCPFYSDEEPYVFCGGETATASCEDLGYTEQSSGSLLLSCLMGYTQEFCPSDSTYYKCTLSETGQQCNDAGYTTTKCLSTCTPTTCPYDSTWVKCTDCTTTVTCPTGYYLSGDDALCDCEYGQYNDGTTASDGSTCYRCGTQSECTSSAGLVACIKCATQL